MRVLVTGGSGFVGRHLVSLLAARGHEAIGTGSTHRTEAAHRQLHLPDTAGCAALLAGAQPDAVVHLAAVASVVEAERDPALAVATNVEGTLSLCRALDLADPRGSIRLVHVSSAQVYAPPRTEDQELDEAAPLGPTSAYGRTKLAAELVVESLTGSGRRPAVIFRPFNHIGPGQRDSFALASFARQIAQAELGRRAPVLEVGDLTVRRDICDVSDIVLAYALAAEGRIAPGTYNLASGVATPLRDLLDELLRRARLPIEVRVAGDRLRPGEPPSVRGAAQKIQAACGWRPKVPLSEAVEGLLEGWRRTEKDAR